MRNFITIFSLIATLAACNTHEITTEQQSEKYTITYKKEGKNVVDTLAIEDKTLQNELQQMMTDPNYKLRKSQNDTTFNSQGNPILVTLADDFFGAAIQKFEYDNQDRLVKVTGYDKQNSIMPYSKDIAIEIKKYDDKGNLIEIRHLGKDGKLISSEFEDTPIIRIKYNANNQATEKWFLDENENLRSEFAILKYKYNDKGEQTTKGWYNEKGESR